MVQPAVRTLRRRPVAALALLAVVAFAALAAGCGSKASSASTPTATASTSMTTTGGAATPAAHPIVGVQTKGTLAPYLVGPNGHTLYVFAKDSSNKSACTGACATNWPALVLTPSQDASAVAAAKGTLDVIDRPGVGRQVTYNGWPLYYFKGDTAPGETKGNGLLSGAWKVASPTVAAAPAQAATSGGAAASPTASATAASGSTY